MTDVVDDALPSPTPPRAHRAMGTIHRVAGKVMSLDGATLFSCFIGGAALEQMAPGLSKTLDPLMVRSTVQSGLIAVNAALKRSKTLPALPSLNAIGERLEARAQARLAEHGTHPDGVTRKARTRGAR